MTVDLADVHVRAAANTQRIVDAITPNRMHDPTPCDGWDVAAVVHHLVYGNLWVAPLVAGGTIDQVGDRFEGDIIGGDIQEAYRASARGAVGTFNAPGAMDAPCAVSYGPVPGSVYCGHRFIELLVHGWDLAVGSGGNLELPADLVEACIGVVLPQEDMLGGSGAFGTVADLGTDVSPQTRLLALLGRKG